MINTQLEELKTKFQAFFDGGLYSGLTNTSNRVKSGKITSIPRSPFINIQFETVERTPWATSNVDKVDNVYNLNFIIKPTVQITSDDRLKQLSNDLNNFSSKFINEFLKNYKWSGDSWYSALSQGSSEIQVFDKNLFYISNKIILTTYTQ